MHPPWCPQCPQISRLDMVKGGADPLPVPTPVLETRVQHPRCPVLNGFSLLEVASPAGSVRSPRPCKPCALFRMRRCVDSTVNMCRLNGGFYFTRPSEDAVWFLRTAGEVCTYLPPWTIPHPEGENCCKQVEAEEGQPRTVHCNSPAAPDGEGISLRSVEVSRGWT